MGRCALFLACLTLIINLINRIKYLMRNLARVSYKFFSTMASSSISSCAANLDLVSLSSFRREMHKFPETGFKEFETQKRIKQYLLSIGLPEDLIKVCGKTGYTVDIKGMIDFRVIGSRFSSAKVLLHHLARTR